MTIIAESDLSAKIGELMATLDQVKKYKGLARSLGDFTLIMLASVIAILFVYIGTDLLQGLAGPLSSSIITPGVSGIILSDVQGLSAFVIFTAAFIAGILWVDRQVRRVKIGEWKAMKDEGTLGAMKVLSSLDWPSVFQEIRYSKMGFVLYGIVKIIGYWIVVSLLVSFTSIPIGFLHIQLALAYVAIVSLVLVLAVSRNDLKARYSQSWALDSLLWELRWFDSEFRGRTEFAGTREGGTAPKT